MGYERMGYRYLPEQVKKWSRFFLHLQLCFTPWLTPSSCGDALHWQAPRGMNHEAQAHSRRAAPCSSRKQVLQHDSSAGKQRGTQQSDKRQLEHGGCLAE